MRSPSFKLYFNARTITLYWSTKQLKRLER